MARASQLLHYNENYDPVTTPDIGILAHPNTASVLELLKARYMNDHIYVSAELLPLKGVSSVIWTSPTSSAVVSFAQCSASEPLYASTK